MLNRKYIIFSLICIMLAAYSAIYAQDNYQEWLKKEKASYQNYLEEEDKAFSEFLKKEWKAFQSLQGIKFDEKPKPVDIPVAEPDDKPAPPPPDKVKPIPEIKIPEKLPEELPLCPFRRLRGFV